MELTITLLPGDGIGPEIIDQAEKILRTVAAQFGHSPVLERGLIGGAAIEAAGDPLPQETIDLCRKSGAVLLGAVGGPQWDDLPPERRPEKGLLKLRESLGLYANLRPAIIYEPLKGASFLKPDSIGRGIDIMVIRELTGGIYFGSPRGQEYRQGEQVAWNTMIYSESEIRRIAETAFNIARKRKKRVCSVDKANVLEVSRLWRSVVEQTAKDFPDCELNHMYVDNAAMQLVKDPGQFDVLLTSNLFGDILSDEAATITGSIGLLPSASLCGSGPGVYEPVHGSAPDIAGRDMANPLGTILSLALMFRHAFALETEARRIEQRVQDVLALGYRTADLAGDPEHLVSCSGMADLIASGLHS